MAKNLELNGLIHAKYPTESDMAKAMNWPRQKLNKITTGRKMPDLQETVEIADALEKPLDYVANLFLPKESPIGDVRVFEARDGDVRGGSVGR